MKMKLGFIIGALFTFQVFCAFASDETAPLLNQPASSWTVTNWINSPPLELQNLRGKVVLLRWWTAPECPFCRATAPALNEFNSSYSKRGLQVIDVSDVKKYAGNFDFKFPVAIDPDWKTLRAWWLDRGEHNFTSVSFLIDRHGIIRYIHPGGQYVKGDKDYAAIRAKIEELLEEK